MQRLSIMLVDDHAILVESLKKLLENEFDIAGSASDGRTMIEMPTKLRPDVVLLDITLPILNGLEAARRLRKIAPEIRIIFLTMNEDRDLAAEALRLGAAGYVLKKSAASEVRQAIKAAMNGGTYVTASSRPGSLVETKFQASRVVSPADDAPEGSLAAACRRALHARSGMLPRSDCADCRIP